MPIKRFSVSVAVLCFSLVVGSSVNLADAAPEDLKSLAIGDRAPDFVLPGVDDKDHRLADFADAKVLVLIFTCNHCPTAQAYEDRMIKLHGDYQNRGVAIVAISPNDPLAVNLSELGYTDLGDSFEDMKIRARDKQFPFPYLYDGQTQGTSLAYGVMATPHTYVFDQQRKLRYQGRIDDGEVKPPKSHDLRNAIDALLAGKAVPVERTRVFGCSTKWSDKRDSAERLLKQWEAEKVDLQPLELEDVAKLRANDGKKFRLINLWATWCAPCIEELPDFVTTHRMYRRRPFEMITISMDDAERAERAHDVLREMHASTKNYVYVSEDRDAMAEALDPDWSGALPHTILVAPNGKIVYRHPGPIDPLAVKKAIVEKIGRTYAAD